MNRKIKFWAAFLSLTVLLGIMSGCGTGKNPAETPETIRDEMQWPKISHEKLKNDVLLGDWTHNQQELGLSFDGVGRFWYTDSENETNSMDGRYQYDGSTVYLKNRTGEVFTGRLDRLGNLNLDHLDGYFCYMESEPELDLSLVGNWTYNLGNIEFIFNDQGEFSSSSIKDDRRGNYSFDGKYLELYENNELLETGMLTENHLLQLDHLNGWFYTDGGKTFEQRSTADDAKLQANCQTAKKRYPLENALAYYSPDGNIYGRVDGLWTVQQNQAQNMGDGTKEIAVVASCYIPFANLPNVQDPVGFSCSFYLYDRYTGLALKATDFYLQNGAYCYSFDSRDGRVELAYLMEEKNSGPVGDSYDILSSLMTFRMPEWYDGLMIAAIPEPDNYQDFSDIVNSDGDAIGLDVLENSYGAMDCSLRFSIQ